MLLQWVGGFGIPEAKDESINVLDMFHMDTWHRTPTHPEIILYAGSFEQKLSMLGRQSS